MFNKYCNINFMTFIVFKKDQRYGYKLVFEFYKVVN